MSFDVFLNFNGDCLEALEFYANVFNLEMPDNIMRYGDNPSSQAKDADKDRVLYASLPILGCDVMFADCPADSEYVRGTNIALALGINDATEINRIFAALGDGGTVDMALGQTFFSGLYGMLTDKFGITWQLSLTT